MKQCGRSGEYEVIVLRSSKPQETDCSWHSFVVGDKGIPLLGIGRIPPTGEFCFRGEKGRIWKGRVTFLLLPFS